tara:strand:+ start:895 stop:1812 length:918 start_codon:yes stop_codon:yes gene_type:complete
MYKKPKVSVLMNCYNSERFIKKSINSVINQTYKNWELIIWDDGSKDNTYKIISKFKDKRIKVFRNTKNLGLGPSRIKAQKKLKGDYIAILDSDNIFMKSKLKKQIQEFKKNKNVSFVATGYSLIDSNDKKIGHYDIELNKNFISYLCTSNIFAHSSIMYKKDIAKKVGWYSKKLEYAQDYDLTMKLLRKYNCKLIREKLVKIRDHSNNMSTIKELKLTRLKEKIFILKKIPFYFKLNKEDIKNNKNEIIFTEIKYLYFSTDYKNFIKNSFKIMFYLIKYNFIIFNLMSNLKNKLFEDKNINYKFS